MRDLRFPQLHTDVTVTALKLLIVRQQRERFRWGRGAAVCSFALGWGTGHSAEDFVLFNSFVLRTIM